MFGYDSLDQVIGRPVSEFDAPEDRERLAEYSRQRISGKIAPEHYTFRGLRRDGSLIDLEAAISAYRVLGKTYILGFVREKR